MKWTGLPTVIIGASGMAKETYHLIKQIHQYTKQNIFDLLGFVDGKQNDNVIDQIPTIIDDENFTGWSEQFPIIGAVISVGDPIIKKKIFGKYQKNPRVVFPNITYPGTMDKEFNILGFGNILARGVHITCHVTIGNFNILNRDCTIGHDTVIGDYNTINPGAIISGNVVIGNGCLIGAGANILQGITIGDGATIGAGAVVIKDVTKNTTVVGVPAKEVAKNE